VFARVNLYRGEGEDVEKAVERGKRGLEY